MAEVLMDLADVDGGLPETCMCCGEPATVTKARKMSWCPPWVGVLILAGLLPYLIVMLILTKKATVQCPLCDAHKGHFLKRALFLWLSLLFVILFGAALIALMASLPRRQSDQFGPFICLASVGVFVVWLVGVIIVQNTGIRPSEITDTMIRVKGVSEEFAQAYQETDRRRRRRRYREFEDDEDEAPSRSRRNEDVQERRPRRSRPSDEIEED